MDQFFEALEKSKNNVVLNVMEQVQYDETADVLEKGKRAQMGEIREWNGLKYQKTPNGWVLVKEEKKSGSEKKEETGSKEDTHGVEKKVLDFLAVSSNKYNDISKVSIYKTPKGNWALQYEGKDVSTVNGSSLPEADLKAASLLKEEKQLFNYEDAVRYIESKGVSCDPNTEIGEYVCDRLDKIEDEQVSEDILKEILKDAKEYSKESEEEVVETDRKKLSRSIYRVLDVNNIKVSEQEISDVLDAVADFVPEKMLRVRYDKSNPLSDKPYSDRAEEILNKYREHFDHWEGTEDMPDKTIKRILTEFLLFR